MFAAYVAVFVWLIAANLVLVATGLGGGDGGVLPPGLLVASLALNSASLAAAALAGCRLAGQPPASRLRSGPGRLPWGTVVLGIIGLLALSQALDSTLVLAGLRERGALGLLHDAVGRASGAVAALMLLVAGVVAPAAEEVFFRGFVQTGLRARLSRWPAIGLTAVAFGLIHLDPVHGAFAVAVGLFLGWLTELAGSIRPAIAAHVANNLLSLFQTAFLAAPRPDTLEASILAVHLAVAVGAVALLRRAAG